MAEVKGNVSGVRQEENEIGQEEEVDDRNALEEDLSGKMAKQTGEDVNVGKA